MDATEKYYIAFHNVVANGCNEKSGNGQVQAVSGGFTHANAHTNAININNHFGVPTDFYYFYKKDESIRITAANKNEANLPNVP